MDPRAELSGQAFRALVVVLCLGCPLGGPWYKSGLLGERFNLSVRQTINYKVAPETQPIEDGRLQFVKIGQYLSAQEYWLIGARGSKGDHKRNCIIVRSGGRHLRYQLPTDGVPWATKGTVPSNSGTFSAFGDSFNVLTFSFSSEGLSAAEQEFPDDGLQGVPIDGSPIPTFLRAPYDGNELGPYKMDIYAVGNQPTWLRSLVTTRRFQHEYWAATSCGKTQTLILASGERRGRRVSILRPYGVKTFLADGFDNVIDVTLRAGRLLVYGIDEFRNFRWATYRLSDRSLTLTREKVWELPHSWFESKQTPIQATSSYDLAENGSVLWVWVLDGRYHIRKLF